jgi:PAS domain S-box-containing protein
LICHVFKTQLTSYIDINDEGLLISGYSRDEMLGRTPLEVGWLTPETRNRLPHELNTQNLLNGLELSYRKKDGSEMIGLVQGEIISLAGRDCLLTVTSDITRQKQAQNALKDSQEQLQAVVQTAQDAIVTMNSKQEIAFWNKAAEDMFGYTASEMLGQSVQTVIPQKLHSVSEEGGSLRSKGTTMESLGLNKAGQEFPVEISYSDWETRAGRFVTAIMRNISERKQNESQLRAIASLSVALRSEPTTARILPVIIDQIVSLLKVDVVSIELIEPETGDSVIQASYGLVDSLLDTRQPKDTGLNAIISQTLKPYFSSDLAHDSNVYFSDRVGINFHSAVGMPLMAEDILIGYLWIGQKNDLTSTDIQVFNVISDIAATAIHRSTLHEQALKLADDLIRAYDSTLQGWAGALELRDQETEGHSRRVVKMTVRLAQSLGMGPADLVHVRQGAILHDIGKMGIPDAILHKPGPLTEDEWQIMRKHPLFAFQLLSPIEHLRQALEIPYCHHEKWDGSGYPRGLVAQEIPLSARVFAVIDIWDALRFDRPYRKAWSEQKVQDYLRSLAGTHLDPKVVEAFLSLLNPTQSDTISPPE